VSRPKLPEKMPNGEAWPTQTRAWYGRWDRLTAIEYDELQVAALLHAQMWQGSGNAATASELRKTLERLSATRDARLESDERAAERAKPNARRREPNELRLVRET
jgi:hypothetical protein